MTITWTTLDRATSGAKVCSLRLLALGFSWEVYRAGRLIAEGRAKDHAAAQACAEQAARGTVN